MPRPPSYSPRSAVANVRLTEDQRAEMEKRAIETGHKTLSEYIRFLHEASKAEEVVALPKRNYATEFPRSHIRPFHRATHGEILWGDSRAYLFNVAKPSSVDLIMTSPPFGLVRKKDYGNEDADRYCDWFRPFAEGFKRALKDDGSLVIDIGGAWIPGLPTRSLYHFKLLIMLVEEFGFHLCQEHYWWNPAKLPTPAEWVNVRRVRVKDAVNCVCQSRPYFSNTFRTSAPSRIWSRISSSMPPISSAFFSTSSTRAAGMTTTPSMSPKIQSPGSTRRWREVRACRPRSVFRSRGFSRAPSIRSATCSG